MSTSTEKQQILEAVGSLPDDASFEDALGKIYLLHKIKRGIRQLDAGQGIPHEQARMRFHEWLD